jgi:hypothetical protein
MLQEANQLHFLTSGESSISGESRKQARDAFEKDLRVTAGKVNAAARWVLEAVLALGTYLMSQPSRFDGLRAYVEAKVDSGPISADEMRMAREMVDAQLWSRERGMSYTGVEDVDAEMTRINIERGQDEALSLEEVTPLAPSREEVTAPTNGAVEEALV